MRFLVPAGSVMPRLHSIATLAADASPTQSVPAMTAESETVGRDHSPTQLAPAAHHSYGKYHVHQKEEGQRHSQTPYCKHQRFSRFCNSRRFVSTSLCNSSSNSISCSVTASTR